MLVWWVAWGASLFVLIPFYLVLARGPRPLAEAGVNPLPQLVGFVPLFVSIVIRWLMLPRDHGPGGALALFFVGLGLGEMCAFLGLLVGGPYRDILFLLGVLGVAQFAPLYARKYYAPKDGAC